MLRTVTGTSFRFVYVTTSWRSWTSRPGLPTEPAPCVGCQYSSQSSLPNVRTKCSTNTTNNPPDTTATTMPVTIWSFILLLPDEEDPDPDPKLSRQVRKFRTSRGPGHREGYFA